MPVDYSPPSAVSASAAVKVKSFSCWLSPVWFWPSAAARQDVPATSSAAVKAGAQRCSDYRPFPDSPGSRFRCCLQLLIRDSVSKFRIPAILLWFQFKIVKFKNKKVKMSWIRLTSWRRIVGPIEFVGAAGARTLSGSRRRRRVLLQRLECVDGEGRSLVVAFLVGRRNCVRPLVDHHHVAAVADRSIKLDRLLIIYPRKKQLKTLFRFIKVIW
jgi:hypothetical protein